MKNPKEKLPNFIVIGAQRAGTTSVYYWLNQYPQIYMSPIKETNHFSFDNGMLDLNTVHRDKFEKFSIIETLDYHNLFSNVSSEIAIGEISPSYMYSPHAADRIFETLGGIKIIAILRDPVERAYSAYLRTSGESAENFSNQIENVSGNVLLEQAIRYSLYYEPLEHYTKVFSKQNIKVLFYQDLKSNPQKFLTELLAFIGVSSNFFPDMSMSYNSSGVVKNQLIHKLLFGSGSQGTRFVIKKLLPKSVVNSLVSVQNQVNSANLRKPAQVAPEARKILIERYFSEDIRSIESMLSISLSSWYA